MLDKTPPALSPQQLTINAMPKNEQATKSTNNLKQVNVNININIKPAVVKNVAIDLCFLGSPLWVARETRRKKDTETRLC